jgi:ribosomal protein L5
MTSRLRERYAAEIVPALTKQFEYQNPMQVPRALEDRGRSGWARR